MTSGAPGAIFNEGQDDEIFRFDQDSDAAVLTLDSACRLVREVGGNIANVYLPKWPKSRHRARIIKVSIFV